MVELKTPREIAVLREAGRVVAEALAAVRERAEVGVTLPNWTGWRRRSSTRAASHPGFPRLSPVVGADPVPGVICASINDAVVHGIPGPHSPGRRRPGEHRLRGLRARLVRRRRDQLHRRQRSARPTSS